MYGVNLHVMRSKKVNLQSCKERFIKMYAKIVHNATAYENIRFIANDDK